MPEGTSSKTRQMAERLFTIARQVNRIAHCPKRCDTSPMPDRPRVTRVKRIVRIAAFALAALSIIMSMPAVAASPQRIVAVGDLHGDYAAWQHIARAAGLIDASGHWAAGKTILVQMGDIT